MSTELQGAISVLVSRVEQKTQELTEMKRMINSLCREAGQPALYSDADLETKSGAGVIALDADQFYGISPTGAAREYLELRDKAVSLEEILDALERGGFDFKEQGWKDEARLRNLGVSLGKNSSIFHRLPNNTWGLRKWYPGVKEKKAAKENDKTETADAEQGETREPEQAKTANAE